VMLIYKHKSNKKASRRRLLRNVRRNQSERTLVACSEMLLMSGGWLFSVHPLIECWCVCQDGIHIVTCCTSVLNCCLEGNLTDDARRAVIVLKCCWVAWSAASAKASTEIVWALDFNSTLFVLGVLYLIAYGVGWGWWFCKCCSEVTVIETDF